MYEYGKQANKENKEENAYFICHACVVFPNRNTAGEQKTYRWTFLDMDRVFLMIL